MPKREQLFNELEGENGYGVLLIAQMGSTPNEVQLIIETAEYDPEAGGLRQRNNYIVRLIGVREHRMTLGIFGSIFVASEHPILIHHNDSRVTVNFEGAPKDINELVLDIQQAYLSTFGPWRELARDINREKPLVDLLSSGQGVLGFMPKPAAERMVKVFNHHGMTATLTGEEFSDLPPTKIIGLGDSYFVALDFSVDLMGKA